MKCPKCQYISFDSPDRCRNCGYDFALAPGATHPVDATYRPADDEGGPLPDLELGQPKAPDAGPPTRSKVRHDGLDLPLFDEPVPGLDDTPLLSTPGVPRAPLAVRRSTPEPSRIPRPPGAMPRRPEAESFRGAEGAGSPASVGAPPRQAAGRVPPTPVADGVRVPRAVPSQPGSEPLPGAAAVQPADGGGAPAPAVARLIALSVDLLLLAVVDLLVVHFTLAILRYPWTRLLELPVLPLAAFCLLLNVGYVVAFTVASGQTIGKMTTGIRIVTDASWRVPVGQAALRAALAPLSLLTLGLGYLPALVGSDRRALHDRLSNTRVVRA